MKSTEQKSLEDRIEIFIGRLTELKGNRSTIKLSKALKIHNNTLNYIFARERKPSLEVALAVADMTGCSLDYLFGRSQESKGCSKCRDKNAIITRQSQLLQSLSENVKEQVALLGEMETVENLTRSSQSKKKK